MWQERWAKCLFYTTWTSAPPPRSVSVINYSVGWIAQMVPVECAHLPAASISPLKMTVDRTSVALRRESFARTTLRRAIVWPARLVKAATPTSDSVILPISFPAGQEILDEASMDTTRQGVSDVLTPLPVAVGRHLGQPVNATDRGDRVILLTRASLHTPA